MRRVRTAEWVMLTVVLFAGCLSPAGALSGGDEPELDLARLERLIHGAVNDVRIEHGLPAIAWNDTLLFIARAHSEDMASNDFFSHEGSDDSLPSDRAFRVGYTCLKEDGDLRYTGIAENIYMTYRYGSRQTVVSGGRSEVFYDWKSMEQIAVDVVSGWMGSPPHRANILEVRHDREGIGVVTRDDRLFITQNLC